MSPSPSGRSAIAPGLCTAPSIPGAVQRGSAGGGKPVEPGPPGAYDG